MENIEDGVQFEAQDRELTTTKHNLRELWHGIFLEALPEGIVCRLTAQDSVLKTLNKYRKKFELDGKATNIIINDLPVAYFSIFQNPQSSESDKSSAREEIRSLSNIVLRCREINSNCKQSFATSIIIYTYAPILQDPQSSKSDKSFAKEEIRKMFDIVSKNPGIFALCNLERFAKSIIEKAYAPILKDPKSSKSDKTFVKKEIKELYDKVSKNRFIQRSFAESVIIEVYAPILQDPQSSQSDKTFAKEEIRKLSDMMFNDQEIDSRKKESLATSIVKNAYALVLKDPQSSQSDKTFVIEEIKKLSDMMFNDQDIDSRDKESLATSIVNDACALVLKDPQFSESDKEFAKEEIKKLSNMISNGQKINFEDKEHFAQYSIVYTYTKILRDPHLSESYKKFAKEEIRKLSDLVLESPLLKSDSRKYFTEFVTSQGYFPILKDPRSLESDKSFAREEIRKLFDIILNNQGIDSGNKQFFAQFIINQAYIPILKGPRFSQSDKSFAKEEIRKLSDIILNNQGIWSGYKYPFAAFIIIYAYAPILKDPQFSESDKSFGKEEIRKISDIVSKNPDISALNYLKEFAESIIEKAYALILKDPQSLESDKSFAKEEIRKTSDMMLKSEGIDLNYKRKFAEYIIETAYHPILDDPQSLESDKSFAREETIMLSDILQKLSTPLRQLSLIDDIMETYAIGLLNPTHPYVKERLSKYGEGGIKAMDALMQKYPDFVEYYKQSYEVQSIFSDHFTNIMTARPAPTVEEPYGETAPITSVSRDLLETADELSAQELRNDGSHDKIEHVEDALSSSLSIIPDPDSKSVVSQSSRIASAQSSRSTRTGMSH